MGALEHGGVVALVGALAGCVIVGKWIYNTYEKDASPGERVAAGAVLVAILGVIVVVAVAMIDAQSGGS
jgi:UDP-N-acetylmuramyl pentapeptide phosphotransferase/UDP-N-acetylglucosamine-1-phosphate transferase